MTRFGLALAFALTLAAAGRAEDLTEKGLPQAAKEIADVAVAVADEEGGLSITVGEFSFGGEGSFKGSFVAALALGIIDTTGKFIIPEIASFLLYSVVLALLLWRPHGLLPPKSVA